MRKPRKIRPRGTGSLFLRGKIWWIQLRYRGKKFLESTETSNKRHAETLLRTRMAEVSAGTYIPKAEQKTIGELLDDKLAHDRNNELRDIKSSEGRVKHLRPLFGDVKARDLTRGLIEKYIERRRAQLSKAHETEVAAGNKLREKRGLPAKVERPYSPNASVNRELALLRSAWLLADDPHLPRWPKKIMLVEENTREGFLRPDQYEKLAEACMKEGLWLRTALELGWAYGWRRGEIFGLKVGQLDFLDEDEKGSIRLYKTKGKKGAQGMQWRLVYMTKKVRELLLLCIRGKNNDDFVLTRDGRRGKIVDFRDAWERAYRAAGIVLSTTYGEVEPLLHDLRRSGAKGMVDRGVNRHVAMKIGGWQTEAMLRRYHIIDKTELLDATAKLDAEQRQDAESAPKEAQQRVQQPQIDYSLTTFHGFEQPNEKLEATEVQISQQDGWWAQQDSNLRPTDYESAALTD